MADPIELLSCNNPGDLKLNDMLMNFAIHGPSSTYYLFGYLRHHEDEVDLSDLDAILPEYKSPQKELDALKELENTIKYIESLSPSEFKKKKLAEMKAEIEAEPNAQKVDSQQILYHFYSNQSPQKFHHDMLKTAKEDRRQKQYNIDQMKDSFEKTTKKITEFCNDLPKNSISIHMEPMQEEEFDTELSLFGFSSNDLNRFDRYLCINKKIDILSKMSEDEMKAFHAKACELELRETAQYSKRNKCILERYKMLKTAIEENWTPETPLGQNIKIHATKRLQDKISVCDRYIKSDREDIKEILERFSATSPKAFVRTTLDNEKSAQARYISSARSYSLAESAFAQKTKTEPTK